MDMYSSLQKQTPTPYLASDSDLENDTNNQPNLHVAILACGSFYLILALW